MILLRVNLVTGTKRVTGDEVKEEAFFLNPALHPRFFLFSFG